MKCWSTLRGASLLSLGMFLAGCAAQNAPTAPSSAAATTNVAGGIPANAAQAASRCVNVSVEGVANLGLVNGSLGALPFDVTIGDIHGTMSSFITGANPSGSLGQGAAHYTLQHTFVSAQGSFETSDRAVCAVAGPDPNVCRVNDLLQIVSGDGVFANAGGLLTNHGTIDLNTMTLTVQLKGRVCGDGL